MAAPASFGTLFNMFKTQYRGHPALDMGTRPEGWDVENPRPATPPPELPEGRAELDGLVREVLAQKAAIRALQVRRWGMILYTEFRYVILVVLLVVAALTLQQTIEDALETFVRSWFKSKGMRIAWMFLFSFIIIVVVIVIVMIWPPAKIPEVDSAIETEALVIRILNERKAASGATEQQP